MLVDRCLVDPVNGRIPVRVATLENLPLKFKNNLILGEMHPVEDFCYMDNTDVGAEVCSNNNYGLLKRVCSADIAPITEVFQICYPDRNSVIKGIDKTTSNQHMT
jgi:hypothetical protein